jgi:hypothetical protein
MLFIRNIVGFLCIFLLVLLFSACKKIDKAGPATAIVSIKLNHSQSSSRMAGVSTSFTVGADTELIALVPDNTTFKQKYLSLENFYQFALTDLSTDTVSLTVPLDTAIKLYSYAYFDEIFTVSELQSTAVQAEQFGESSSFTISSGDTSKEISLKSFDYSSGLLGLRYNGYFNDDLSFFDNATEETHSSFAGPYFDNITTATAGSNYDDTYSVQWKGYFKAAETGIHIFYTKSDDSSWLWLGSKLTSIEKLVSERSSSSAIVNNSGLHGVVMKYGFISLEAGKLYPILIYFGENSGGDIIEVSFTPPSGTYTFDGTNYFFRAE